MTKYTKKYFDGYDRMKLLLRAAIIGVNIDDSRISSIEREEYVTELENLCKYLRGDLE